ncbi:hypothetical protein P0082_09315 [Candidatus Haliotispira prima]|uniref:Uncharacterized protein n=1 Tax=Candidatus Haliotispira prima TaxID=3034016 RepID=A0ABY8MFC1_9SPIO|nr:hypothetical protein P0082_09315 [Candidatus Haliotispira prima]
METKENEDIRERKGSFFTPRIWVEKSQEYIADVLGKDWQDEYYVWDCAAGTGNLLAGLTNKYNIWASTLDKQDVDVMHDRIKNGANLPESHCFQFDFLNDDFSKLPPKLKEIINNEEKRKKLVMYINPPYAEASTATTITGTGTNKTSVANKTKMYEDFHKEVGTSARELFVQFLLRINKDINGCILAQFSTLKIVQAGNFEKFRSQFKAKFKKGFIVPANTFDNVKGNFPIGFMIWDLNSKNDIHKSKLHVYNEKGSFLYHKNFQPYAKGTLIIDWLRGYYDKLNTRISYLRLLGTDFQHNKDIFFTTIPSENDFKYKLTTNITKTNIIPMCIYLAVRHCIKATWLNDRDQFLYPQESWLTDTEFQNNSLAYALFHRQNRITGKEKLNHWIPFTETEVEAKETFTSNFMHTFISGKIQIEKNEGERSLNEESCAFIPQKPLEFSTEAQAVFDAGRELWRYYHACEAVNGNASFYDIREHFQGRNDAGKMNSKSTDTTYNNLLGILKMQMEVLRKQIVPKVYEHGFLLK